MKDEPEIPEDCPRPSAEAASVGNLVGLALSGGGIRSATFNLGFLQGLAQQNLLEHFDYLSTVSGGGFIGAWWSAWLSRREHVTGQLFPTEEDLELQRREATAQLYAGEKATLVGGPAAGSSPDAPDKAAPAAEGNDPIHFVRMYSNYLTPKTGLMSPDTWRLIAYFVRSLLFTWLALVPMLLAAVLLMQSVYLFQSSTLTAFLQGWPQASQDPRLEFLAVPASIALAVYATLAVLWLIETAASRVVALVACVGVGIGTYLTRSYFVDSAGTMSVAGAAALGAAIVTVLAFVVRSANLLEVHARQGGPMQEGATVTASPADRRTWLTHQQERVLKVSAFAAVLLVAAAFAHDVVNWFFGTLQSAVPEAVRKAGGWGAAIVTAVSTLYTLSKKAPTTTGEPVAPAMPGRVLMAIAPPLLVVMLIFGLAVASHHWLVSVQQVSHDKLQALAWAGICLAAVEVSLAIYEFLTDQETGAAHAAAAAAASGAGFWWYVRQPRRWVRLVVVACLGALAARHWVWSGSLDWTTLTENRSDKAALILLGVIAVMTFARPSWRWSLNSARPAVLLALAPVTATLCVLVWDAPTTTDIAGQVGVVALLAVLLLIGLVVALGWLADPNLISMHGFYKARIARAYLGASNAARASENITEAAPGDDVPLTQLWNHDSGGPYHLINTSLNLVGGSDLAMAQRLAENFVLSRYHCGSARAGYRYTAQYMSGQFSLATAAAVSGAAVSPTMGSQTPSAAMTLLLSLFNIRLGFWAPAPSGRRWYESHARLWPFYLLRETLANTGSIGTYMYLTDGGHFDNTGLYALVERGCRHIVVCDCGADPKPNFDDIGNAIRRCRIDFGAEIDLSIKDFVLAPVLEGVGTTYVGRGKIRYQRAHLQFLGLSDEEELGEIVWVKPTVTDRSAADVRQYRRAHNEFPQQTTAEQWYDESQFESYRRLGYESAAFVPPFPAPPPARA
jgi:predicted acylesterase/phospholipase RssA